jgi:hypothetical protein
MPDWLWKLLLAAVMVQMPFELRYEFFGLSNLQWTFVALTIASAPLILKNRTRLIGDRLFQAAALFVAVQWLTACMAPEFQTNAIKAAVRFTAGFILLVIIRASGSERLSTRVWVVASSVAAVYALVAYAGLGFPGLFRTAEFYIGQVRRLSGSFEYPNTAAAYFSMSLPIVWWSSFGVRQRSAAAFALWAAIILTFSKGGLLAVPIVTFAVGREHFKKAVGLLGIGAIAYVLLLPLNPYVLERIYGSAAWHPIAAEYSVPWNDLREQTGRTDSVPLTIRNTGMDTWPSAGLGHVSVGSRWWNMDSETFMDITPVVTPLDRNVARGEAIEVPAAFRTPDKPGHYLLVLGLFSRNFDWFSPRGVIPMLIRTDIALNLERSTRVSDLSALYRHGQGPAMLTATVPRQALWKAALKMFIAHPFGAGPDNYRLEYGKYLDAVRWDTHVYSNNLYWEILTGSGVLGLLAFLLLLASRRWGSDAASLSTGIFLVHGVVDVFLMTTPIYFAFWMLLGWRANDSIDPHRRFSFIERAGVRNASVPAALSN